MAAPHYARGSSLKLEFCVIDEGKAYDAGYVLCQDGQATALDTIHPGLKGLREGPTLEIDKETGQMRVSGLFSTLKDPMLFGLLKDKIRMYADKVVVRVTYVPDEISMPKLTSQFVSPKDETWRGAAKA